MCAQLLRLTGDAEATCKVVSVTAVTGRRLLQVRRRAPRAGPTMPGVSRLRRTGTAACLVPSPNQPVQGTACPLHAPAASPSIRLPRCPQDKVHVMVGMETKNADATLAALQTDTVFTLLSPAGITVVPGSVKATLGAPVVPAAAAPSEGSAPTADGSTNGGASDGAAAPSESGSSGGGSNTGAIVGGVIGALAVVAIGGGIAFVVSPPAQGGCSLPGMVAMCWQGARVLRLRHAVLATAHALPQVANLLAHSFPRALRPADDPAPSCPRKRAARLHAHQLLQPHLPDRPAGGDRHQ